MARAAVHVFPFAVCAHACEPFMRPVLNRAFAMAHATWKVQLLVKQKRRAWQWRWDLDSPNDED
eukprot:12929393-Prorocentrum_lima.AAC.1